LNRLISPRIGRLSTSSSALSASRVLRRVDSTDVCQRKRWRCSGTPRRL